MKRVQNNQVYCQKSAYPKNAYYLLEIIYIFAGFYDHKKIKIKWRRIIYRIYQCYMVGWTMIWYYSSEIAYMDQTSSNLKEFLDAFGLLLTQTVGIFKWLLMLRYSHILFKIQLQLEREEYHYEDYGEFNPGALKTKAVKYVNILIQSFIFLAYAIAVIKDYVFMKNFLKIWDEYEGMNIRCMDLLPFVTYVPFKGTSSWGCFWAFVYQAIPMSCFVAPIIAFDLTFLGMCTYTCVNFINIGDAFGTMRARCLARLGLPEDYKVLHDAENPRLEREIAGEVRRLSIHLQDHLNIVDKFENICNFIILAQAFTSTFVLITILYLVTTESEISPMLISQVQYCVAINLQLFSYCFVGDAITEFSATVLDGIYSSDWLSCTRSVKVSLMINMMRLQRPLYFTIGKFSPLTLNSYLQILKGSYSYYTMFSSVT